MKYRTLFTLLAAPLIGSAATAQSTDQNAASSVTQPTVVYELFTSQGCSSCPPANEQINRLAKDDSTLALSYGVTYWDYLGWKDTFADPAFTQRQHDYVAALGARNAYTPQIIVNGESHAPRLKRSETHRALTPAVTLQSDGETLSAEGGNQAVLVTFTSGPQSVPVSRGENSGHTLVISNVVSNVELISLPHSFTPAAGKSYALLEHGEKMEVTSAAVWRP